MATSLSTCFHHAIKIPPLTSSSHRTIRIKPPPAASSSDKLWTPLFGSVSSDPDYIHSTLVTATDGSAVGNSDSDLAKSRFAPGCFTEEKAKQMRMKMIETMNFHDIMYHSAIASRLASDVSRRHDR